jgi:dienelactone hydrolase
MAVSRQVIIHEGPGGSFESMWVGDAHGGAKPGILLFPNILGTKEWDFAKAEEVAAIGYTVLVADLYGQGKRGTSMESGMALMKEVSDDRTVMRARLLDELATLKGSPAVDTSRLGAIGFCFGGQCVLDLARAGADIKGGVSFHGVYDAPPFPNAPISAKLLICHGWNDCPCRKTQSDWQLIENRAMLLRDERSCQAHCLDGRRSVSVADSARGGNLDVAAADKRSAANRS